VDQLGRVVQLRCSFRVLQAFQVDQAVQKVLAFLEFQGVLQGNVDILFEEVGMEEKAGLVRQVDQHVLTVQGVLAVQVVLVVQGGQVRN